LYAQVPQQIKVPVKPPGKLTVDAMKLGHLLTTKVTNNGQGTLLMPRLKFSAFILAKLRIGVKTLNSLPPVYRKCAVCYTDFWDADQEVIPAKRHKAVGKIVAKLIVLKIQ